MDSQAYNTPGLGLPQAADNGMTQSQPAAIPQGFHAPDNVAPHFNMGSVPAPQNSANIPPSGALPLTPPAQPITPLSVVSQQAQPPASDPLAGLAAPVMADPAAQPEDTDTPFDEEWVYKAKEVVARTLADPYLQSIELTKLKAAYIKARYNKDIKVSD